MKSRSSSSPFRGGSTKPSSRGGSAQGGQRTGAKTTAHPPSKPSFAPQAQRAQDRHASGAPRPQARGLIYRPDFVLPARKKKILAEIKQLFPIWENRFSKSNPPPQGQEQRRLLRPVYWLGNWQFACLNYYHPPKGIDFRCVEAEPFPPEMQAMVDEIQEIVRNNIDPRDIPREWELNTCLVNYYGSHLEDEKKLDVARVGEHKDFEPGPVASISFGDKALFQFVTSAHKQARSEVVLQQWLEDSSLQIFGGDRFKKQLFHRVQRVDRKRTEIFDLNTPDFETRRLNFTFRYVPREHIQPLTRYPANLQADLEPYVRQLANHSPFFKELLTQLPSASDLTN